MTDQARLARMENQIRTLENQGNDHEVRVREIEKTIWKAFGVMSLLQVIITIAITIMKHV